jgi:hypothetical protein
MRKNAQLRQTRTTCLCLLFSDEMGINFETHTHPIGINRDHFFDRS